METAVSGVVEQISDVKGDVAKVMGMFPSLPQLPEGSFLGLPIKWIDPSSMLFATTPSIENGPADNAVTSSEQAPEGERVTEPPASEETKTHHHPPPPPNDAPPPPNDSSKPPPPRGAHSLY